MAQLQTSAYAMVDLKIADCGKPKGERDTSAYKLCRVDDDDGSG